MNSYLLLNYVNILLIFTSLFFAFFLITVKSKNKKGNIVLALFLIVKAIDIIPATFPEVVHLSPIIDILRMDVGAFFQSPLLYLFVLTIIYKDFKPNSKHFLLFLPFFISTIILMPNFYLASTSDQLSFYNNYTDTFEGKFSYALAHVQNISYIIATFILLAGYKRLVLENFSIRENINFIWLFQMNMICLLLFVAALIKNIYRFGDHFGHINVLRLITSTIMLLFTCWLIAKALYAPTLFRGISSKLQPATLLNSNKSPAEIELLRYQKDKLLNYMKKEKPFLNPDLTIGDLANQLDVNEKELSVLINTQLGMNFYEFVSQYRINKAKRILVDKEFSNLTILEILYMVGFNSKSSFNTSFKKATGVTPTVFRKNHK